MSERRPHDRLHRTILCGCACIILAAASARCTNRPGPDTSSRSTTLRLGVSLGQLAATNPLSGLRQLANMLSIEGLVRIGEDARPQPWLAAGLNLSTDRRTVTLNLRPGVKFHDGTPVTASIVKKVFDATLPGWLGPAAPDVESVEAPDDTTLVVRFHNPSPMLLESLEVQIQKPGNAMIGTGPFEVSGSRLLANTNYYLGRPIVDSISVTPFPSVRAAWADLLRNRVDMLYEVGADALESLQGSSTVSVYKFTRRYQYEIVFGSRNRALAPAAVRRAISAAIDRQQVVDEALGGNGVPSTGAIWPKHWALDARNQRPLFEPAEVPKHPLNVSFTCLVAPDYDRIALVVKRQLETIGVEMRLEERSPDELIKALQSGDFDTALFDAISGASVFRLYEWWHTGGSLHVGGFGSESLDRALDAVRNARDDDEFRKTIAALQQEFRDDPPAIFLAWSERARAVSTRFEVPSEPGRDVIGTLRLWKPVNADTVASRN